jgi:acyl carrier protein
MSQTTEDLLAVFRDALLETTGKAFPNSTLETSLFDLGLESIEIAGAIARIEDVLSIRIDDVTLASVNTLGDLQDIVARLLEQKKGSAPA